MATIVALLGPLNFKQMPWKNGLGVTTELAKRCWPADAEAFAWRVSRAAVASDGAFSAFPGVDRTLLVLPGGGPGLILRVANGAGAFAEHVLRPLVPVRGAAHTARV